MTATPLPGEGGLPPFAIYRAKVAAWEDGTIKLLYTKLKGQGSKVLIEEHPGDEAIELGNKYQLTLVRIEDGAPVPPIEMPGFPVLPEPPIAEIPPGIEPPIYKPEYPTKPEQPIYRPEGPVDPGYGYPGRPTKPGTPDQGLPEVDAPEVQPL